MEEFTEKIVVIILAGGKGERLSVVGENGVIRGQLTEYRAKTSLSFAGKYRMADIVLSNCWNSKLYKIFVLTQYKSQTLYRHIAQWQPKFIPERGDCLEIIQPQAWTTPELEPYSGTADAVYENLFWIQNLKPELVLVLSSDHVYKMDYRDLILFHRKRQAELTVVAKETDDRESAKRSGVLQVDQDYKVIGFEEKPREPKSIPGKPGTFLISMGIYVFNHKAMAKVLKADAADVGSKHDFGHNIIPKMVAEDREVFAFPFKGYWQDIGTIDSYHAAQMDLVSTLPQFNLYDKEWPWWTFGEQWPPGKIVFHGTIKNLLYCEGCIIDRAEIYSSVISPGVKIGMDARISNSVIMEGVTIEPRAVVNRGIIDKDNVIPADAVIEAGRMNYEGVQKDKIGITPSGIVVMPRYLKPGEEAKS
ncbi:MAG: hypothetical protein A2654_00790 [Candidatus Nealsonbacteria bacterium RIFCSPHIGHO2_01_FULL_43_31]|uniref:Uncharacterized protein n=2 Tax=Candidatus Nealsoniibacteriota TaxID=1817911 RepID=A0A1G2E5K2_9BACT|nr:MAG: Glucose-1-phosphate adenylyltransferase [Parcubacteria group bacterium GW2011_GWB1_43_6]OGZ20520.1 MAG: hypothetical protein A2654_00790 [Candidatus Nealsonbacteria bacterium RIFCSPHIGHO2_01_FULL_43_31]OGZ21134.1 MAG: hypothetical protein A3D46_02470 [Candidatus Nealsonbacteria bacterium RIFCSPHIGHO2_02_FULL_43_13]OGZ24435.1 MAG: hypothetical protein A2922_00270 [Candidatus Nealsonbacteria bacterium RIFCSPLOWO2_01_FULL_43_36]